MKSNGDENMCKWIIIGGVILVAAAAVYAFRNGAATKSITFDEYVDGLSRKCDQLAKKLMKQDSTQKVVGGKCEIKISPNDSSVVQAVLRIYKHEAENSAWSVSEYSIDRSIRDFAQDDATQTKLQSLKSEPILLDFELPQI